MIFKDFSELGGSESKPESVEPTPVEQEEQTIVTAVPKIDRRAKLAPKEGLTAEEYAALDKGDLSGQIYNALITDPETREKIVEKVNTSLKTEFVIGEAKRKKEELAETSRKTAEAIRAGNEAREKEKIEQERKIEEQQRVLAETSRRTQEAIDRDKAKKNLLDTRYTDAA